MRKIIDYLIKKNIQSRKINYLKSEIKRYEKDLEKWMWEAKRYSNCNNDKDYDGVLFHFISPLKSKIKECRDKIEIIVSQF